MIVRALLAILLCCCLPAAASAQDQSLAMLSRQLAQAENDLADVDRALDTRIDADQRKTLRAKAAAAQHSADDAGGRLQGQLALVEARVAGLGVASTAEAPEIVRQRADLARQHNALDAAIKRGRLASVEGSQLIDEIDRSQAEQFSERISTRVASPVGPSFWQAVIAASPRDFRRIHLFALQGVREAGRRGRGHPPWQAPVGLIVALLVLFPLRIRIRRAGQRFLIEGAPGNRVRRSANALWRVLIGTLAPLVAAWIAVQGFRWAGLVPTRWDDLADQFVVASGFFGFTAAITGALLMRTQPSWRVAPFDDDTARRLRPLSWVLAILSFASIVATAFNLAVGASTAATLAMQAVQALTHLVLLAAFLVVLGRLRAEQAERADLGSQSASASLGAITLFLWLVVAAASVALLLGYVGFGLFAAQFVAWATVLGSALYLLMAAVDDIATAVFARDSRLGYVLTRALGLRGSMVDQFGLILSGVLRLALVVIALGLLLTPFGAAGGIGAIFGRMGVIAQGIDIGGVSISPGLILRGLAVLFVGLAIVRAFMRWLEGRYLPATDLDGSGRNSVSLIARYVGTALAAIWALASLGIGVEKIALLLSALSVGIGFGLQAITQNFVSGLILLAERPIKIGDLVRVGSDEGDVKRISVRSTEIELADHSTLIVPNSELVTKSVLNKTLSGPLGRMQIQFTAPLESDTEQVRRIVLDAFAHEEAALADPEPKAFVDSIVDGRVAYNCFAHVASPRAAYGARSNVLRELLRRFREEGIEIGTLPQKLELLRGDEPGGERAGPATSDTSGM